MAIRLLIVDDDNDVREMLTLALAGFSGIEVVGHATNGREAVEQAAELKPDVVVMDLLMPLMDGAEATVAIRKDDPDVMVVGFTAVESEDAGRLLRAGAVSVIEKTQFGRLIELFGRMDADDPTAEEGPHL
jgi:CheY-like chemotaxis protein